MKKFVIIVPLFGLLASACTKDKEYEFIIENDTFYILEEVQFSCAVDESLKSVNPDTISDLFIVKYRVPFLPLTEPLLCLTILKYSDSLTTVENTLGRVFSISDLSEDKTNILKIELDSSSLNSTDIFNPYILD